jgi:EAL domain-containing protein (putative c-di-GMP-specific phosphodiesterase class I)
MLTMAEGLGLGVVAEGVDSLDVAETLRDLGCRRAQGELWAKPEDRLRFATRLAADALDREVDRAEPA